jgi:hypothetical protein
MGVLPDIQDREVGGDVGGRERKERHRHQDKLHLRGGRGDGGKLRIAQARAGDRQHGLHEGNAECEDQRVMAGFCDHPASRFISTLNRDSQTNSGTA